MIHRFVILSLIVLACNTSCSAQELLSLNQLFEKTVFIYKSNEYTLDYEKIYDLRQIDKPLEVYRLMYFDYGYDGKLPFESKDFPNLQELTIVSCHSSFPSQISGFQNLQVLVLRPFFSSDFCYGQYEISLSKDFFNLKNLRIVDFRYNYLSHIPDEIHQLKNLVAFWANAPRIEYNEDLGMSKDQFESFWLRGGFINPDSRKLRAIPLNILKLNKLRLFAIVNSEYLLDWKLLHKINPNVIYTGSANELEQSVLDSKNLLDWVVLLNTEKTTHDPLPNDKQVWQFDSIKVDGSFSNSSPNGVWEFSRNNIPFQIRDQTKNPVVYSLFNSEGLLTNKWFSHYNTITETRYERYSTGNIYRVEHFFNSMNTNGSKMYHETGQLKATIEYTDYGSIGTMYSENGSLLNTVVTKNLDGFELRKEITYSTDSSILFEMLFKNNYLVESFDAPIPLIYINDSLGHIVEIRRYDKIGNIKELELYKYENGLTFQHIIQTFHQNGQMASEKIFAINKSLIGIELKLEPHGEWRIWNEKGKLIHCTNYEMGVLKTKN